MKLKRNLYKKFLKRPIDFVLSLISIILLSPILIMVALLVRIKLGSPILFKQKRPGLDEKIFTMYKFRTMTDDRDEKGELLADKVRLTKLGKTLRKTSLDELPELFNILKGDMSFVGPRPLSVKYLPYYTTVEKQRHLVSPGLTGLAQVNGRNKATWEQRFALDREYVNKLSLVLDLKIILNTILVVFRRSDIVTRGTGTIEDFHKYRISQKNKSENL
ncbi:sugar transferase [Salipaludibacillus sp. CUR1]|uniref:sugar transferase n=1 Tax=Salipaludibacillus sp. CUR1 TaxID=2820003 RepID=UPI001E5B3916|nr:sugar transferase [Salipaludibacillus sp. CUR1]MCE7791180.1 sugar transferase [Salipaludibacillus sp. CUR1]